MSSLRLLTAIGLAAAIALAALAFTRIVPPLQAQPQPHSNESQCTGTVTGTLSTNTIRICDQLSVTVKVAPSCPICPSGVNVVYIQPSSAFMANWMVQESLSSLDRLRSFAEDKRTSSQYPIKIGVVHYNSQQVRQSLQMTDNIDSARGPLSQPINGQDLLGDVNGAARAALEMMREARRNSANMSGRDYPCEFVVFFASTKPTYTDQGRDMIEAAHSIKGDGIKLFVGCPEVADAYCNFSRDMAAQDRYYTQFSERGRLSRMVEQHMDSLDDDAVTVRDLVLTQFLPSGLAYVVGSANVPPKAVNRTQDDRTRIDWEWRRVATAVQTVTYSAKPLTEGLWPIEGAATIVDVENKSRELPMPSRPVTVSGLCLPPPTETPTDIPTPTQIPTDIPTPTRSSSPTPTPTRTDTPTPEPQPIYLPITLIERCTIQWVYSDIALVIDMSTSMNQSIGGRRTKLDATLDAAEQFLTIMDFTLDAGGRSDRVAVVGFNAKAWTESGLTNDVGVLSAALDRLPAGQDQFTRVDLGFEAGLESLRPAIGQPNTTPVMILLTDGLPNRVPLDPDDGTMETTVRKSAQKAKDAGVKVYTIGIGLPEDINGTLMRQCATLPADYFYTPDPEALAGIYAAIAYSFGCPAGRHDWGRPWP